MAPSRAGKEPEMTTANMARRFTLVYQIGIANVFEVECLNMAAFGREARRVLQADYRTCEQYARGLAEMGAIVATAHCDQSGDIAGSRWTEGAGDLWGDKKRPVEQRKEAV
jgi:hypothetical protein